MEAALQIAVGLVVLASGGEALVRGSVGIARRAGMSELAIGLTLVGFGTSMPELVTSLDAALIGAPGIAIGNVVGSNIGNILLVLGIVVLLRPIAVTAPAGNRDTAMVVGFSLLLCTAAWFFGELARWIGGLLFLLLVAYLVLVWRQERATVGPTPPDAAESGAHAPPHGRFWVAALLAAGGLAMLILGADQLVTGAVSLARSAGISETVIGLSIVAIGTSLPELFATGAAALKGRSDLAAGNIAGSNIFNILGILGVTAVVTPVAIPPDVELVDWLVLIASAILLFLLVRNGRRLTRFKGACLVMLFLLYMLHALTRHLG